MASNSNIGGCGPLVLALHWAGFLIASVLVILRAIHASKRAGKWRWDFVWIALAFIPLMGSSIALTFAVFHGLGNHIGSFKDIQPLLDVVFWLNMEIVITLVGMLFAKFSIVALLLDALAPHSTSRYGLWAIAVMILAANMLSFFAFLFQCSPLPKLWKPWLPGSCDYMRFALQTSYPNSVINGLADIIFALWPIFLVYRMNVSRRRKLTFSLFMIVISLTAVPAFARIWLLQYLLKPRDPTYVLGTFMICVVTEAWVVIIFPSIITLRPLWRRWFTKSHRDTSQESAVPTTGAIRSSPPHGLGSTDEECGHTSETKQAQHDSTLPLESVLSQGGIKEVFVARNDTLGGEEVIHSLGRSITAEKKGIS